jgi:hypothetical protein
MAIFKYKNADGTWETVEPLGAVKYIEQDLTELEKQIARANIGSYIKEDVILNGKSTSVTFPSDKAPRDYDLLIIGMCSDNGMPAGVFTFTPNRSFAIPTVSMVDANGNTFTGVLGNVSSDSKGCSITISATYGSTATLPQF